MSVILSKIGNQTSGNLSYVNKKNEYSFDISAGKEAGQLNITIPECTSEDAFPNNHLEFTKNNGSTYCIWYNEGVKYSENGQWSEDADEVPGSDIPSNEKLYLIFSETGILGEIDDEAS